MAIIQELITDNIVAALETITVANGYTWTVGAVEQERSVLIVNNRYPFIEVAGPMADVNTGHIANGSDEHTLEYVITYLNKLDDSDVLNDEPLTKQVASVYGAIHKAIMTDHTRGGYAVMTRLKDYGYSNFSDEQEGEHFDVFMVFEVQTFIDSFDMTLQG